jgi:hypothetical protein
MEGGAQGQPSASSSTPLGSDEADSEARTKEEGECQAYSKEDFGCRKKNSGQEEARQTAQRT